MMGLVLRERLGDEGSTALADFVESYGDWWQDRVTTDYTKQLDLRVQTLLTKADFDARVQTLVTKDEFVNFRLELKDEFIQLRKEMANQRVEILRWSFLFWIGQVAATVGLISLSLHFAR